MLVSIGGREVDYKFASLDYDDEIGQRSTASFAVVDRVGNMRFKKGQPVRIYEGELYNMAPLFDNGWEFNSYITVNSPRKITINSPQAQRRAYFDLTNELIPGETYTFSSIMTNTGGVRVEFFNANDVMIDRKSGLYAQSVVTFTVPDGTVRTRFILWNQQVLNEDVTFEDVVLVPGDTAKPFSPMELVFGGVIDRPVSRYLSLAGEGKIHHITCADWHYIADKRIVARTYLDTPAGEIVNELLDLYLKDEGIKPGEIQTGPVVIEAVFNYVNVTQCMDGLAEKAGFEWYIDAEKKLHFFERSTFIAPININENSDIRNVEVEPASVDYRNRQYIRGGKDTTDPQTERFKGDGGNRNFTVSYDIAEVPTVTVNGQSVGRVGIRGLEEGLSFYWSKGSNVISQDENDEPLTDRDTLEVTYKGFVDIVALSYDANAIEEMRAIEGGTGLHENVLDDPHATSRMAAFQTANAKLRKYAQIGNKVSFDTKIKGLKAGQLININLPSYNIDGEFLIESIQAQELGTTDGRLIYRVIAVDGAATGGWSKFFKNMATRGQAFVLRENIREDEVLTLLETFSKTWLKGYNYADIFEQALPGADLLPGFLPSFAPEDRVKYLAFLDDTGNEVFRKPITKQTITENEVVSTTIITPFEANDINITRVVWYGGNRAGKNRGSGVRVDTQPFVKRKNDMESIQIDKTDIKGDNYDV